MRESTIALFDGLDDAALVRGGVANGNRATVRALGWHIAGHELHHLDCCGTATWRFEIRSAKHPRPVGVPLTSIA